MKEKENIKKWEYLASAISGETDHEEAHDLIADEEELSSLSSLWKEMEELRPVGHETIRTDHAWEKLRSKIEREESFNSNHRSGTLAHITFRRIAAIAAMLIIVAGLGWGLREIFFQAGASETTLITLFSGDERNSEVELPDGSRVILNSNTRLIYPASFNNERREVEIDGEALFEVIASETSPFIVKAGGALVEVLGTTFNVNTQCNGDNVEVFVEKGKVMIKAIEDDRKSMLLEAGYIATARGTEWEMKINDNPNYLSWNTEVLTFNGETLNEVFIELRRAYNIEITADDPDIGENRITTVFEKLPAEEIVRIISTTFNLTYQKDGEVYVLSH